jgi:PPK2 family polyphosphate:nucleotide phosphotransferase
MPSQPTIAAGKVKLKNFAADFRGSRKKKKTKAQIDTLCRRIGRLQKKLHAGSRYALLLVFEGMDCSGKDGAIRSVLRHVNPAGVETSYFKTPSADEQAHDYLWRIHRGVPARGTIGIFNRSHYEAVLVERVTFKLPRRICRQRYAQIRAFEQMLAENGVIILKFFLHLSREEQRVRLRERLAKRCKQWKFQRDDLDARRHWKQFMAAYEEVLSVTSQRTARWHIVPADRKWYRDYVVAETVVRALQRLQLKWPRPRTDLTRVKIPK